jgi:rod shape determining protein RodA
VSIGSGGLIGKGYNLGTQVQLRFLKIRVSDYIFAAMGEEFGFIGVVLVMLLILFVIYRCLRAARLAKDTFGALLCYGVAMLIAFQAMVNIGVNLRLLRPPAALYQLWRSSMLSLLLAWIGGTVILRHGFRA